MNNLTLNKNAFSSSQVLSKIWMAENLESAVIDNCSITPRKVLCLGGWYGLTNFILRTRDNINIGKFRSVDIDQEACDNADLVNKAWEYQEWQFKSICEDVNKFTYSLDEYDTVINTSSEHMENTQWFDNIPIGALVVIQSNNMPHEEHCHNHNSVDELAKEYPLKTTFYSGTKNFTYPDWSFDRYMIIGIK